MEKHYKSQYYLEKIIEVDEPHRILHRSCPGVVESVVWILRRRGREHFYRSDFLADALLGSGDD